MRAEQLIEHYVKTFALNEHLNAEMLRCLRLFQHPPLFELYTAATEQTFLYFLVSGKVQISQYHLNGKLSVLAMLNPLAIIGDLELFSDQLIKTNVVTAEETTLLGIEREFALKYGRDDVRFLHLVIHNLTFKLYQSSLIQSSSVLPLVNRLATYLLNQTVTPENAVRIPDKTALAALLGTTPRHLNRVLKTLQDEGIVRVEAHVLYIISREGLRRYTQS